MHHLPWFRLLALRSSPLCGSHIHTHEQVAPAPAQVQHRPPPYSKRTVQPLLLRYWLSTFCFLLLDHL